MTDELRAAAERVIQGLPVDQPEDAWIMDAEHVARAYLAEHSADDDEPATVEWVLRVGFEKDEVFDRIFQITGIAHAETKHRITFLFRDDWDTIWSLNGVRFQQVNPRRGQVRRLASVLGIELKEPT